MRILLLAMPDSVDFIDNAVTIPNLAIISLAGSLPGHDVKVLDLVIYKNQIRHPLSQALANFRPQLVGLSAMTFQFDTLLKVAGFIRNFDPQIKIIAGGYHASLMAEELSAEAKLPLDFIIRREGEVTLLELVTELESSQPDLQKVMGLSYRQDGKWIHNENRPLQDLDQLRLPNRQARLDQGFHFLDMPLDIAETSRGCPYNCKFCSITKMYGRTFRKFSLSRIIADLREIRQQGTKAVFFADDNITYDINHFRQVCQAIIQNGLNDLTYITQVSAVGIAQNPELVADMDQANFRIIFVGFESMEPTALKDMNKPTSPEINKKAAALLHKHRMGIVAGCIIGYPDDTKDDVRRQIRAIVSLKPDSLYAQVLTPYPKTALRQELLEAGLIVNPDNYQSYNGFAANIRTKHLTRDELNLYKSQEALRGALLPELILGNYFFKHHTRAFLSLIAQNLILNLKHQLFKRGRPGQLDI